MLKIIIKSFLFIAVGVNSLLALTPELYYKLDISNMNLSLKSAKKRLECLSNNCHMNKQIKIDNDLKNELLELYGTNGITVLKHIKYYTRNKQLVTAYYENNETLQTIYSDLIYEIEDINTQLKDIMESNQ